MWCDFIFKIVHFYANSKNRSFFRWLLFFVVLFFYRSKPKSKIVFVNLIDFEQILQDGHLVPVPDFLFPVIVALIDRNDKPFSGTFLKL